ILGAGEQFMSRVGRALIPDGGYPEELRVVVFPSRSRHTRLVSDWSSDVCSSDLFRLRRERERIASSSHLEGLTNDWYNGILRGSVSLPTYVRLFVHTQLMPILENGEETTLVGGQAVMEGVMMRAPHSYCVAVRKADGEIVTEQMPLPRMADKYKIFKYPIFRGVGTLAQAMSLGMKALKFSADVSMAEIQMEEKKKNKDAKELPGWVLA